VSTVLVCCFNFESEGWKKRLLKLRKNGDLEYYHGGRLRGSFSMLGSAVILDRKDACRFEIDTGRGIWHLRTPKASDRDVWVKNIQAIGVSNGAPLAKPKSVMESRLETVNKNIVLLKSLEAVLSSRVEVMKSEAKLSANLDSSSEHGGAAVVLEDSGEHHKKKKKGHSRTKSEDIYVAAPTFLQHAQEFQRTVSQLITTIDDISAEFGDAISKLETTIRAELAAQTPLTSPRAERASMMLGQDETKDTSQTAEPMILYNEEVSGSDSEDYFDADMTSAEDQEEDDSSSSMEYFEPTNASPVTQPNNNNKRASKVAAAAASSSGTVTPAPVLTPTSSSAALQLASHAPSYHPSAAEATSSKPSASTTATTSKPKTSKSRRLSRGFSEETRQASLKFHHKPSGVSVNDTLGQMPSSWAPRPALPFDKPKGTSIPIMKILKDAVGKDISRITIPVSFSEPINMLQRLVEDFEYGELLLKAVDEPDPRMRLLYVSAFASSSYASIYVRRTKPFNPILGETYEFVDRERQYRLMTEQVSHHPPIAAFTVDSPGYSMWGHAHAKTKFWGKSLEINPTGSISLRLLKHDEVYTWNKITTCMNNIIVGTKWIDNYGALTVINQTTGHKCLLDFKKQGWFGAHAYEVVGTAYDPDDTATHKIEGFWNDHFAATPLDGATMAPIVEQRAEIWKKTPLPEHAERQYFFTSYTIRLNELPEWMKPLLPPTDSRLRPDQRALEDSNTDFAQTEKSRLEDKQRAARKKLEEEGTPYEPTWFSRGEGDSWMYKGGYWESRHARKWPATVPDIF